MKKKSIKILLFSLFLLLLMFPLFGHLDTLVIRVWDEARLAMNAVEMLNDGDLIVTHYDGQPDMWNTKPPLLIWIQVIFMKLMGVNELAVRLPSAIAALATCFGLIYFFKRYLKSPWIGYISAFVLVTTQGFVDIHSSRTGDYDTLLTLFTTTGGLFFFAYLTTKRVKQLYIFFFLMALSVLTKSITGLVFIPAFLAYALLQKELLPLLKNKHTYLGLGGFLVLVLGYYFLREVYNPGYIAAVQENELGGRYLTVIENHSSSFWYYYDNLIVKRMSVWYLLIPCGLLLGLYSKNERIKKITLFSVLMILSFFLVISTAQTKLEWYDVPMLPFLAIVVSVAIYVAFDYLKNATYFNDQFRVNVVPFLFLFLVGIHPYQTVLDTTYFPKETKEDKVIYELSYYLKNAVKNGGNYLDHQVLLYDGYNAHLQFYIKQLNDKNVHFSLKDWKEIQPSETVITNQKAIIQFIKTHFEYTIIGREGTILIIRLNEAKGAH